MGKAPRILTVALESYHGVARLPRALKTAGFEVGIICKPDAFLAYTRFRDQLFLLPKHNRGRAILSCLEAAVREWPPTLVIPMDDKALLFLLGAFERLVRQNPDGILVKLLRRSFGNPSAIREATSKRLTMECASKLQVRIPAYGVVTTTTEIVAFAQRHGFPVVVKRSFGYGGSQVFVCHTEAEILSAWARLRQDYRGKRRFYRWRDRLRGKELARQWMPVDNSFTVSQFISGCPAMSQMAAFEGRALAILTAHKIETYPNNTGPSSVVRFAQNEEMGRMAEAMIAHWKLTGFIGFDFMVDEQERPWLLECNARPTSIAHLGPRVGIDLCQALYQQLMSQSPAMIVQSLEEMVIAHFPQESWRDPNSPYLTSVFHDMPSDDPGLLRSLQQDRPPKHRMKAI